MLLETKQLSSNPAKERPLLRQVLKPGDHDDFLEERIITYVNSLKIAANNHNKTKQEAEIYTDWANHYLEKARFKRYVQDLQVDIADGVLLADVIEAVTNEKVRNINKKPKNSTQMIENINSCLAYLAGLGVNVDGLTAKDIRDGNLKAILGLFFSLSRHKQQQKQASNAGTRTPAASTTPPAPTPTSAGGEMLSRLPSPFRQTGSGKTVSNTCSPRDQSTLGGNNSSIPTPTSTTLRKQGPQERTRTGTTSSSSGPAPFPSKVPSASSSRSASPGASAQLSFIPQPTVGKGTPTSRVPATEKHSARATGGSGVSSASNKSSNVILRPNNNTQNNNNKNNNNNANAGKNSMLDKLKFFNSKDKNDRSKAGGISKRTSSSSGFSSARSERSDSSNSLCSETKPSSSTNTSETRESSPVPSTSTSGNSSPRLVVKAFARKTFGRTNNGKETKPAATTSSPKNSRKPENNSSIKKGKETGTKCNNNNNNNNNNKTGSIISSDVKPDGNSKTEKLPNSVESASDESKEALQNDTSQPSQQNNANYSVVLEPDNPVKQSKVSFIPKGEKGKQTTATKQHCTSRESLACDAGAHKTNTANTGGPTMNTVQTNPAGGTSIPKPTAAVKGTSKVPKDDRRSVSGSTLSLNQNTSSNLMSAHSTNLSNKELRSSGGIQNSKGSVQSKSSHRISPAKSDASTLTDPPKTTVSSQPTSGILTSSLPRTSKSDRNRGEGGSSGVSIAMVSPMQTQCKDMNSSDSNQQESLPCRLISGSNDPNDKITKSNFAKVEILGSQRSSPKLSTSTHSKVETTFDSTDKVITRETTPGVPRETTFSEENEDIMVNIKPMQPIIRASPYSYMRSLGVYPTRSIVPSLHVSHMGLPTSANSATAINRINVGRQLMTASPDPFHIYTCNTSQMKRHMANGPGIMDSDYVSSTDPLNFAAGYMSDGDVLRADSRGDDIGSGYMSEGGASLYARRAQTRMREGITNIKECIQKTPAFLPCDRTGGNSKPAGSFDDSSSVSSGISDTIAEISTDENLTGSSVSSDQTNPYASLKRAPKEVNLRSHNSAAAKRIISSDANSRAGNANKSSTVKKADTAQQTESSAFRQVSSSTWKKYLLDKDPSGKVLDGCNRLPQDKAELLRRGKSDLDPSKTRDKRGSGNSGVMGALRKSTTASGVALNEGIEKYNSSGSPKSKRKGNSSNAVGGSGGGGGGVSRYRMSTENLCTTSGEKGIRGDRISPRSSRNGSTDIQGQNRMTQGLRGVTVGSGFSYSSKRPTSTCSVSSNGSSKSTGSKVSNKRSSSDKLSELDHLESTSEAASYSSESSKGIISVSGNPRNGPASTKNDNLYLHQQQQQQMACGSRGTLDRKNKIKVCSNSQTSSTESQNHIQQHINNVGAVCENESGHNSLSRRLHQHQKSYTMTPLTASAITSGTGGLREHIFGSRGALNSSPVSSDLSTVIQNPHAILGNRTSPRLSVPFSKPQDLVPPAPSPSSSSSSHGILGLDHPSFGVGGGGTYPWIRHSPSAASALSRPGGGSSSGGGWLTEAESLESLASSLASSVHAHLQHARANSLTHARLLLHQRETSASPVPKLSRSNSIRSTKSEKLYPSMLQRSGDFEPYLSGSLSASAHSPVHKEREQQQHHQHHHSSQPTSPTPGNQNNRGYVYPVVSGSAPSSGMSSCMGNVLSKITSKEDDMHGSSLSLVSTCSSLYSSTEDKQVQEIRKLRRELCEAHDKVHNLTSQLSTNKLLQARAHAYGQKRDSVAEAFYLQAHQLQRSSFSTFDLSSPLTYSETANSQFTLGRSLYRLSQQWQEPMEPLWERPVGIRFRPHNDIPWWEIATRRMRYRSCPIPQQAHVVAAFEQSLSNMTCRLQALTTSAERKDSELNELRSTIEALRKKSVEAGLTTAHLQSMHRSPNLVRRHTFNTSKDSALQEHRMSRQLSTDSMSSINSMSSACSAASQTSGLSQKSNDINGLSSKKKKKKGWLRSSFSKAFSRSKKNKNGSVSDVEDLRQLQSDTSAPNSPLLNSPHMMNNQGLKISHSSSAIYDKDDDTTAPEVVKELKKQLREKDMVLTDIRLEALSSAHQLESLKETVNKMRSEMVNLKHDNERLQRLVSTKSLTSSQSSLPLMDSFENKFNSSELSVQSNNDAIVTNESNSERDGKRVTVSVFLGCHGEYEKYIKPQEGQGIPEVLIGSLIISAKTKWDLLDSLVRRVFKEYVLRVDPVSNLGLNAESVTSYHIGDVVRSKDSELPELLPYGYIVGDNMQIRITLRGTKQNSVDALAFETLLAKSIVQRYVSLLSEHRRIILCGPSGTGKTFLAHHLSEFLVLRSGKELTPGTVATFSVDHKSAKELRQYLSNVADQCESNASDLPSVIILDNLHHVGSLGEVFNGFLNAKYQKCPYIIGTMNQTTCSTTNLQLHHNFRWVLCANHMEPVKGFLGRYLRRKLIEHEVHTVMRNNDLIKIIDWMPKVWQHLNKFLEAHSSSDVTIGPRLFLSCPNDVAGSQVWFTDLWNYSIVPYLLEAVREGLQLYGRRAAWEDPTAWVLETYPWQPGSQPSDWPSLLQLRPEDVGYDTNTGTGNSGTKGGHAVPHELEADPLLNMLMRLQEAASYSSPHSNDSDNTSLESHNSSLQTDDVVNTSVESTL